MSDWKKTIESMVGAKGVETLSKAIHRRDSDSTIGPLDVYLPLLVIPRAILSWLVQNIKPIPVGESKELTFPGMEDIKIKVEKNGRDSYRGEFIKDGKVIHSFEKQTLPNVGGNLMTVGELYEDKDSESETEGHVHDNPEGGHTGGPESQEEGAMEDANSPDIAMPRTMMQMMAPQMDQSRVAELNATVMGNLTYTLGRLIDALVANHLTRGKVEDAINSVKAEPSEKDEHDKLRDKINELMPSQRDKTNISREERAKNAATANKLLTDAESKAARKFSEDYKKVHIKKTGFQEGPSGQAAPKKPDGVQEPIKPTRQPQSRETYFKQRLDRARGIEKKEKEYFISEEELYTPCPHCGTPEFEKSETGPKYKPCACFYVTLRSEEGKATSFVRVMRKSQGGYSLSFNKDADIDTVQTFLMTLKNKLLKHKDSLS